MRSSARAVIRSMVLVAGISTLAACARLQDTHGYVPEDSALETVVVGRDTKDTVALILGRPGTQGVIDDRGWYYVRSEYERFLWRAPVETDRQVVAISFDEAGVVQNIERFGLDEGRVVTLSRRVTDPNTRGISFLRQLFGNLGRIDAGSILNDG